MNPFPFKQSGFHCICELGPWVIWPWPEWFTQFRSFFVLLNRREDIKTNKIMNLRPILWYILLFLSDKQVLCVTYSSTPLAPAGTLSLEDAEVRSREDPR